MIALHKLGFVLWLCFYHINWLAAHRCEHKYVGIAIADHSDFTSVCAPPMTEQLEARENM